MTHEEMRGRLEGRMIVLVLDVTDTFRDGSESHSHFVIELDSGDYIKPDAPGGEPDLTVGPWGG